MCVCLCSCFLAVVRCFTSLLVVCFPVISDIRLSLRIAHLFTCAFVFIPPCLVSTCRFVALFFMRWLCAACRVTCVCNRPSLMWTCGCGGRSTALFFFLIFFSVFMRAPSTGSTFCFSFLGSGVAPRCVAQCEYAWRRGLE